MPTTGFIDIILAAPSLWCGLAARSTVRAPRKVDRPELMIGVGAGGQRGVGQPRRHAGNVPPRSIIPAHQHTRASSPADRINRPNRWQQPTLRVSTFQEALARRGPSIDVARMSGMA